PRLPRGWRPHARAPRSRPPHVAARGGTARDRAARRRRRDSSAPAVAPARRRCAGSVPPRIRAACTAWGRPGRVAPVSRGRNRQGPAGDRRRPGTTGGGSSPPTRLLTPAQQRPVRHGRVLTIVVEADAALAAEIAGKNHPPEQRGWAEARLLVLLVQQRGH